MSMSFEEYTKQKFDKKKKKPEDSFEEYTRQKFGDSSRRRSLLDDIVPVRKDIAPASKKSISAPTWFQKSEYFKDGTWDKGDLFKTIFGSATDVGENATAGAMGGGEKFLDALVMIGNALSGSQLSQAAENEMIFNTLAGKSNENTLKKYTDFQKQATKGTEEFVKKDLYDEEAIAKKIISAPIKKKTGIDAETASVFGEKSDAVAQSAGQLAATKALSLVGVPWFLTTGGTAFGGQAEQALNEGATYEQAMMSATVSAGAEVLSEKLTGGIKFGSKTLDEAVTKPLIETISNKAVQKLVNVGVDAVGEGSEEVISSFFSRLGTALYKEEDLSEILASEDAFNEYLDGFIGGAFLGGASSTGKAVKGKVKGFDPVSELTDNEQKVVDKIVSDRITEKTKDGNKLTTRDKIKIREAVKTDMEKGRIDIDTLESILGGETYNNYKSVAEKEEALQNEFNALNKMKQGDMTGEQLDRRAELKQQLEELKSNSKKTELKDKLSKDVFALAKDSRLVESYNEKARRGKAFEADLSKYDAAQQETIKKAVDSGILNNTNRTHEFVDMLAKISADKGVLFDFTSNEKLKNSSFALEGKTVNGYVTGDGNVAVNIDSSKSLNTVVGHEITHILEGTELYDALHQSIVEYAKAKGDYDGRYKTIEKLYEGIEGADINKELTADLVGDYLFTDENFIRSLSTEQPGVFKKVYDEIKYLCKVATAGSKEARELEKIKKTFSDIYRDSGKAQKNTTEEGGVKYMISKDVDGNTFVDVTEDIFDVNNGESVARTIQRVISERFNNLIEVNGQKIQINKTTNDEFRRSNSAMHFLKNPSQAYNDKLKTIANADEILSAAKGWIGEERAHDRKDDIVEFARANVMFRVGENGYVADVLVGIRENGAAVLYDLVNIYDKEITEASVTMASEEIDSQRRQNASVTDIIPQNSEKSSENRRFSLSDNSIAPTFYSQMGKVIDSVKQEKLGASSIVPMLKGKGVKNEEIKWSGIETFLEGKKSVTKQELQEFIANNQLDIEIETLSENINVELEKDGDNYIATTDSGSTTWYYTENGEWFNEDFGLTAMSEEDIVDVTREGLLAYDYDGTNWHDYKLNGGSNYRELLFKMPNSSYSNDAMYAHWKGIKGVLAHARIQDFIDAEGKKVLFIEEIQSDWHNQGQKKGYVDKRSLAKLSEEQDEVQRRRKALSDELIEMHNSNAELVKLRKELFEARQRGSLFSEEIREINRKITEIEQGTGIAQKQKDIDLLTEKDFELSKEIRKAEQGSPDAPFRNTYHEYVLKRLLRMAAEQGYDKIAWTTGKMQEERWSSEYAEGYRIEYDQDIPKFLNKYGKKWGAKVGNTELINEVVENSGITFRADEILARRGIREGDLNYYTQYRDAYEQAREEIERGYTGCTVPSIDITDSMKASVLYEGQPFYSLSPEDAQPVKHGDYHVTGEDVRFAPVREDIAEKSQNKPQKAQKLSNNPPVRKDIASKNATDTPHGEDVDVSAGDDITDEPVSITTVKERLEANLQNATTELENNKKHREESIERINTKIAEYQAMYESKKNKDTQVANNLLRSIERLKNNRDNITAQYDKRINDIEKRIDKINVQLQQDHTKEDKLERALKRIDTRLEREKQELIDAFNLKKGNIEETTADKDAFVSKKAYELYRELWNLKKGVRASQELSAMLDYKPDWGELKRSLLHIKASPSQRVDEDSSIESIAREIITTAYEDELYSVDESYAELKKQLDELDTEAEKARQRARKEDAGSIRQKKQGQYEQEVSDLIGDTSTWQDKSLGISYQTNTLHRNLRDVVRKEDGSRDIEKADRIYEYLQGSYNRNEAELKRESKKIKKAFLDMKINKYESEYIQMVGELRYYPGTTLTRDVTDAFYEQHKKKIDVDKVEKAITESRKVYDDLIQRVNAVLKEQGMKEIPYIKGYYPHFTKDKQGLLGKLLNWKTVNNDIPTDIAGLTEMFTPVRTYQSFNKHREARETDYDFAQGFDTYVHGALDWIYHIEDIQKRRAFENVIRYRHSEDWVKNRVDEIKSNVELDADESQELIDSLYKESKNPLGNFILDIRNSTNNLAGKKSTVDRTMEYATNRHVYSTMTNISNRVSANAVAGSISSALTNFIPITQSWGQVNPVYSLAAAKDAVRNTFRDDGMINKSTFMVNRLIEEDNLKKTAWDVAGEKLSLLMNVADRFSTEVVWRSKYLQNIKNGMSENQAIDNADIFAENVMAGRSRGNMPTIFNSKNPVTKTLTAFQLEVANQYGYMFKDLPQDIGEKNIKKLVSGYTKMFVGAYLYNVLFSALTGRDAAFDPIGIIVDLCKDLGLGPDDEEDEEPDVFGAVRNLGENVAQEIPFVGGLLGGGRIPISSALPYELKAGELLDDIEGLTTSENPEVYKKRFIKEFLKPVYYTVLPMGGGQLKKSVEGLKMFDDDLPISGSYTDSGNLRFPVEDTPKNKVQAAIFGQYANDNAQKYFDEGYAPLKEKQIQEFIDVDIPIADYWKYREGLKGLDSTEKKFDYVNGLNLPVSKKNILINNLVNRKEPVDLENYGDFSSLEEFDYSVKNPGKYAVSKVTGGYESYKVYSKALSNIEGNTDNFGKTISGSRKINVANYISGLDADYYTKIILFKSEYNSDHRYDYEIVTHLNSRNDLTYEEKVNILTELGFTVGADGNIGWE